VIVRVRILLLQDVGDAAAVGALLLLLLRDYRSTGQRRCDVTQVTNVPAAV
jgi:hypothetical protein